MTNVGLKVSISQQSGTVPARRVSWLFPWLPTVAVVAFVAGMLLWMETPPAAIGVFGLYVLWGLALPGTLVYRFLRQRPHTLIEDLAMGMAVGYALELIAWSVFSALDLHSWLRFWPLAVVLPFALVRPLRRHWRPVGYRTVPVAWSWTVALVVVALVSYLSIAFLRVNPPVPTSGTHLYFLDQLYQLSLVGEAKNHFPMMVPQLAGEVLGYHWFTYAHEASASLISGIDTPVIHFRLFLPLASAVGVVLLAVLGWRVSGQAWAGPAAAALVFAVGELAIGSFAAWLTPSVTAYITWSSNSVAFGWIFMFPLLTVICDRIAARENIPSIGQSAWLLMGLLAFASAGSKSTILPIVLCGLGLALAVSLLRRRLDKPLWIALAITMGAQLLAMAVIYRFESYGVSIRPLVVFEWIYGAFDMRSWWKQLIIVTFVFTCYVTFMFARLITVVSWIRFRPRPLSNADWLLIGGMIGGLCGTLLLYHPALGQNYFLRTAFPLGAVLSAMGYVLLIQHLRLDRRIVATCISSSVIISFIIVFLMWRQGAGAGGQGYRAMLPMARAAAVFGTIAVVIAISGWLLSRRVGRYRALGAFGALTLVLFAGSPTLAWDAYQYPNQGNWYHDEVTGEQATALRWLRDNSSPNDLVATNRHLHMRLHTSLTFALSGFSERRFLLEAWGYTSQATSQAERLGVGQGSVPFSDQELLRRNDAAFTAPSADAIAWLRDRGVRWLVADETASAVSPNLGSFARYRISRGSITIYELP